MLRITYTTEYIEPTLLLLEKLYRYGFRGHALQFIQSYFHNRFQFIITLKPIQIMLNVQWAFHREVCLVVYFLIYMLTILTFS